MTKSYNIFMVIIVMSLCELFVIGMNLCAGLGTDEKAVTWILGQRTTSQRQLIRQAYQQLYKESLIDNITSELSGDFRVRLCLIFHSIDTLITCAISGISFCSI